LAFDHYLTALFNDVIKLVRVVAGTFLNAEKSVGGPVKKFVTSSFFQQNQILLGI